MVVDICERVVDLVIKVDEKYNVFNKVADVKNNIKLKKEISEVNINIANIVYNELLERFYNVQDVKIIIDKYKLHKKDLGLLLAGPIGSTILGYKMIKSVLDNNLNVDDYYKKFIKICDEQGLIDNLLNNINYVPNDEELINLMKNYKRRNNIDLIEILHCKCGQINIKYKNN